MVVMFEYFVLMDILVQNIVNLMTVNNHHKWRENNGANNNKCTR
ncbi:MAG: hypothetical protein SCARUB_04793 [Candidatus Scalindua rubra]|uniref:Uncharacterized protein n=1 Tax=Candidatus Scalindua rubra TaxID=1872076 RepID=A0A1E3X3A0_9BACT|nr:MAG: hypothetical protein SCARUB_04793 [Candidatus Scalindua rubra]